MPRKSAFVFVSFIVFISFYYRDYAGPEYSIFVGDLGPEVNDHLLYSTFAQHYATCRTAKVVTDPATGLSRGYGFVRFTEESEQQRAMLEMQGQLCGSRQMRISAATPKNRMEGGNWAFTGGNQQWAASQQFVYHDPNNTTVFVGGLVNGYTSEEDLMRAFGPFGPISYVKIPPGKGCGFVSFVHRQSAEQAITHLNGAMIGPNRIRLSWGRSSAIGSTPMSSPVMSQAGGYGGANWISNGYSLPSAVSSPDKSTTNSSPFDIRSKENEASSPLPRPFDNDSIWRADASLFASNGRAPVGTFSPMKMSLGSADLNFGSLIPGSSPSPPNPSPWITAPDAGSHEMLPSNGIAEDAKSAHSDTNNGSTTFTNSINAAQDKDNISVKSSSTTGVIGSGKKQQL